MKIIRVNMSDLTVSAEETPDEYRRLGGRGLTSAIIDCEVPAGCDPLGPENKLILAPGFFSGTSLVNNSRISAGAKSPLTGGVKEANAGGTISRALARLGVDAVIIEGRPAKEGLSLLRIDSGGRASLQPADEYAGLGTYDATDALTAEYGDRISVLLIGPAGENLMKSASLQTTDVDGRPCRAAGRGGLGAVMGAKGVKAVVVDRGGELADAPADTRAFNSAAKAFSRALMKNPRAAKVFRRLGTSSLVAPINEIGAFPSFNARQGYFEDWEKISGEALADTVKERGGRMGHLGCEGCIIHCSNVFVDRDGRYVTSSLEYETIWSMGGMLGVADLDAIARLDRTCDDLGLDTINTGVALAVAMDSGYRDFGDADAAFEMLDEIARATDMGRVLGDGPAAVGRRFDNPRVPACKGQSIAAYDPRALHGNAVTYSTSPMGADHTAGNNLATNLAAFGGKLDPTRPEGQVEASRNVQIAMAAWDCTGLCMFAAPAVSDPEGRQALLTMLRAKYGGDFPDDYMTELGKEVLRTELGFNRRAGFTRKDDRLPDFFYTEPLPPTDSVVKLTGEQLDETFAFLRDDE